MSKNFELFQQIDLHRDHLRNVERALSPTAPPQPPRLKLHEAVRSEVGKLVHRLFLMPSDVAPRVVVFTGIEEGQGATKVCAYAADLLAAQVSAPVCVVDANLRAPALHQAFGWGNGRGFADLVMDSTRVEDVAARLSEYLWLITSGSPRDEAQIVDSESMRARMADLRARFDFVLVNAPPAGLHADAISLGLLADGIILVLQANSTRREVARQVKYELDAAGVRVLGAVLNDRTFPVPEAIYSRL